MKNRYFHEIKVVKVMAVGKPKATRGKDKESSWRTDSRHPDQIDEHVAKILGASARLERFIKE